MYSLRVTKIEKLDVQADNNTVLDVTFDILNDENVEETRRQSFPLNTSSEDMQTQLKNFLTAYQTDKENEAKNAELNAAHAQADATISTLTGMEIKVDGTIEAPVEQSAPAPEATPEVAPEQPVQ